MKGVLVLVVVLCCCIVSDGIGRKISTRPSTVKIGAIFTFNSTIGRAAKIAIEAAVDDINASPNVLKGTKLVVKMQDTKCSGFLGTVEGIQIMETGTIAIVGPQSSVIAHVLSHIASELQIPLLSFAATDPSLSSLQYPFFVRTTQSDWYEMRAVSEIVQYYSWNEVIAIYVDNDYGRNGIAALRDELAEKRFKISYKAALPPGCTREDVTDLLAKITLIESRVIVVHANSDSGLLVLSVAHHLGMMKDGFVWIATDWLSSLLDTSVPLSSDTTNLMQGVVGLRHHIADSGRKSAFVSRWNKHTRKEVGRSTGINSYALYAYDTVWLIACAIDAFLDNGGIIAFSNYSKLRGIADSSLHLKAMDVFDGGKKLLDEILKIDTKGITGPIRFDSSRNLVFPAYDIINVIGIGYRKIGYWSSNTGLSVMPPEKIRAKGLNRSNVTNQLYSVIWPGDITTTPRGWAFPTNGKKLKVGVPLRASYQEFVQEGKGVENMKGYCIDVFTAAVSLLPYPLTYDLIPFGDGLKNPSYSTLVNKVASGEYDAAIGDIAIVTNRTKVVDFTQPYIESGLVILAADKKSSSSSWAFLQPFTLQMWCMTGGFFLVIGAVMWILEHRQNDEFRGPPKNQIATIFWFSFSTLFFAHRESTVSTLGRFVLLIWLFVVLIVQSSYTASLTSILTVQQLLSPVKGIESLVKSKGLIGFQVGSFAENYMVEELHISRSRLKTLYTPDDYARELDSGGVIAVVDERPYIDIFLSNKCKFTIIGSEFTKSGWGFAFPRDSPLAQDMSTAILTLSENGELQRIHEKWLERKTCSSEDTMLEATRLPLRSFYTLFIICGLACCIALLIYFFTMLHQFRHRYRPEVAVSAEPPTSGSVHSIRRFFSFVDEKEEENKQKKEKKKIDALPNHGSSPELSVEPCSSNFRNHEI